MFQKKYSIDKELGSKVVLKVVKFMVENVTNLYGLTEIARKLNTSKSNIHRALQKLQNLNLLQVRKPHGRKLYKINSRCELSFNLWSLVMSEKGMNLEQSFRDTLQNLQEDIDKKKINALLFLPGLKNKEVDFCVVGGGKRQRKRIRYSTEKFSSQYKFEPCFLSQRKFESLSNPLGLDALLNGIPLYGEKYIFKVRSGVQQLPKSYVRYKIEKVGEMIQKLKEDPSRKYLRDRAISSLREIEEALPSPKKREKAPRKTSALVRWRKKLQEKIEEEY